MLVKEITMFYNTVLTVLVTFTGTFIQARETLIDGKLLSEKLLEVGNDVLGVQEVQVSKIIVI